MNAYKYTRRTVMKHHKNCVTLTLLPEEMPGTQNKQQLPTASNRRNTMQVKLKDCHNIPNLGRKYIQA